MYDKTACHMVLDRVLQEIESGDNFAKFSVDPFRIEIEGSPHGLSPLTEPYIHEIIHNNQEFTRQDASFVLKLFDNMDVIANA